jgi:site-specific DNA-methyltransferase (adenine-specific)
MDSTLEDLPQVSRAGVTLYNGDALDVLPRLGPVADLVVTDPPYKLSSGGNATQVMGGLFSRDRYDNSGDLMDMVEWSEIGGPLYRAAKTDADAYVMANDKQIFAAHGGMIGAGWRLHNLLVWNKGAPTRNRWYMKENEYVLYMWKGRATRINAPGSRQTFHAARPASNERIHVTQKPVDLLSHYIENSSAPGDLVLDPFAGSGATLVAAMRTGRKAIGIELDTEIFAAAIAWLEREDRARADEMTGTPS